MDRRFLELMGRWLLDAARGQKQVEDMARWMGGGADGVEDVSRMIRNLYGMSEPPPPSADRQQAWEKALDDLRNSYREWLDMMRVVPRSEFESLAKRCKSLEEKVASQRETIRRLRLKERDLPTPDSVKEFTDMMAKQGRQFQELMDSMGKAFTTD
jgi:hypothetical protein